MRSRSASRAFAYGPFRVSDFVPDEMFARFDGTLARVCDPQPAGRLDHIYVWTRYGTSNAERVWLHKTALAYAISEEQGWAIERRRKENASS